MLRRARAYYEFNFAPSTQWAAYRFSSYRSGMRVAAEISAPLIEVQSSPDCYTLQASLELDRLSGLPGDALWRLGLSAVIEDTSGRKSYWALAHPPGKPDFHHSDCFAHRIFPGGATMKFGIDRLIADTRFARATQGQARGIARASRFRHGRPDACARCAGRLRRPEDQRCFRSAAWPARRQARQHDRVRRTSTIRCMAYRSSACMETCASRQMR